jgi:transcriptional regulator with XRE-family HTH domain
MERKKAFGQEVKSLRKQRGLSQQDLARNILGITPRTLGKIERGEKGFLDHDIVSRLATCFSLEGLAREEFFSQAGLSDAIVEEDYTPPQIDVEAVRTFFENIDFPAYAHDAFYNLYALNSSMFAIFGANVQDYTTEFLRPSGPHLLRILFEMQLEAKTEWAKDKAWRAHAEMLVYRFRVISRKYVGSPNYNELLNDLKKMPEFREIWRKVEKSDYVPRFPPLSTFYLRGGEELRFISTLATDTAFMSTEVNKVVFIPASEETRQHLARVTSNIAYFYLLFERDQPNGYTKVTPPR